MKKLITILPILFLLNCCSQESITLVIGSTYFPQQSGDITFSDEQFQDGTPGAARTGFLMRNPAAYVEFRTEETDFDVKVGGNWSGHGEESKVYLLVDGVYNQSITLTADDVTQSVAITSLSPGLKTVKLVCGYAANPSSDGDIRYPQNGTYVQGVVTTGNIQVIRPVTSEKRIVVHGMSITTGASGTRYTLTGWIAQMKSNYHLTMLTYGAGCLCDNATNFSDASADSLVAFDLSHFGSSTQKEIWVDLQTNEWGAYGLSKAIFKSYIEKYVDKVHAADASIRIIYWRPLARTNQSVPNISGATLQDMADAIDEVAATRSSYMFALGAFNDGGGTGNTVDGVHYNQTGHDLIYSTRLALYQAL